MDEKTTEQGEKVTCKCGVCEGEFKVVRAILEQQEGWGWIGTRILSSIPFKKQEGECLVIIEVRPKGVDLCEKCTLITIEKVVSVLRVKILKKSSL